MSDQKWEIIGRGKAGWHANAKNVTSSGGDLNPYTYWTGEKCSGYAKEAAEGALVYDAKDADENAFAALVISGPMVDPSLPPEAVNKFGGADAAAQMRPGLAGAFGQLADAAQSPTYSGLDYVGLGIYRRLLAAVPGVKFGRVEGGIVVWE